MDKVRLITNQNKKVIGWIIFGIFFILFLYFSSWFFQNAWIFLIIFIVLGIFLKDSIRDVLIPIFIFMGILLLILLVGLWQNESTFWNFTINNQFMLVLLTAIYVILTYFNLKTTKEYAEISRLPYLSLRVLDDLDIRVINVSNRLANDIEITFKFFKVRKESNLFTKLVDKLKEDWFYKKKVTLSFLIPKGDSYIPMKKIFEELFPVAKYNPSKYDDGWTYKLKKGAKEFNVRLIIECLYSSDTHFKTVNPLREEACLYFKKNHVEIIEPKRDYGDWKDIT